MFLQEHDVHSWSAFAIGPE